MKKLIIIIAVLFLFMGCNLIPGTMPPINDAVKTSWEPYVTPVPNTDTTALEILYSEEAHITNCPHCRIAISFQGDPGVRNSITCPGCASRVIFLRWEDGEMFLL